MWCRAAKQKPTFENFFRGSVDAIELVDNCRRHVHLHRTATHYTIHILNKASGDEFSFTYRFPRESAAFCSVVYKHIFDSLDKTPVAAAG